MNTFIKIMLILILFGSKVLCDDLLFKKEVDDKSYLIITSKDITKNEPPKKPTRTFIFSEDKTIEFMSTEQEIPTSLAQCLYVKIPNITNIIWERKYYHKDPNMMVGAGRERKLSFEILDINYWPQNGYFAILWVEANLYVFCNIVKSPPFPGKLLYHSAKGGLDQCCELKIGGHSLGALADTGKIIFEPESSKFKVTIKTIRNKIYAFEKKETGWVEIK